MRVLLRCEKDLFDSDDSKSNSDDPYESDFSGSEHQLEESTKQEETTIVSLIKPSSSEHFISVPPSQSEQTTAESNPYEEISNRLSFERSDSVTRNSKKRPRSPQDSKPAAIVNMVGGGRRVRHRPKMLWEKDDDEPFENEPPAINNNNLLYSFHSAIDSDKVKVDPVLDDDYDNQEEELQSASLSPSSLRFREILKKERGLEIVQQKGDGNCLFRAVSLQVYGDASMHAEIRERCLDFMERDPEHFAPFVDGDFTAYIARKRRLGVHGNNPEIQAMSELFNRPVEVFTPDRGAEPLNIFQTTYKTTDTPIRVSYHDGNHYNAVIDPLVPTAGLGLGLPGLQPGLADKLQLAKAVVESDHLADELELQKVIAASKDDELQRAIEESAAYSKQMYNSSDQFLASGIQDDDEFDLEQKVLMQSLEEYHRQQGQKQQATSFITDESNVARLPEVATDPVTSLAASATGVASIPPATAASASSLDEYPPTVQELVMNGFELRKVVHAYELIGDDFNDLLAFLMSNS